MGLLAALALVAAAQAAPMSGAVETLVHAPGPSGPLSGTMLAPTRPGAPVVLIVPRSGPTDREGNGPGRIGASTYLLLAEGLAARGVATVRVDKRGMYSSRAAVADTNAVRVEGYAADFRA